MEEIALLDLKPLLVNQATRVLETAQGRCWLLYWVLPDITTLRSVVVAWKQVSVGALIWF